MELPLPVAISAVIDNDEILLIRRKKGDFIGLLGMPGGKIEKGQHVSDTAVREVKEETNIDAEFKGLLGVVSEKLIEDGKVYTQFLLLICELEPGHTEHHSTDEGDVMWLKLHELHNHEHEIIPSDFQMIKQIIQARRHGYYEATMKKTGNDYVLKDFKRVIK